MGIKLLIDKLNKSYYQLQGAGVQTIEGSGFLRGNFGSSIQNIYLDSTVWVWFLLGGLVVILIFVLFNFKKLKGGI